MDHIVFVAVCVLVIVITVGVAVPRGLPAYRDLDLAARVFALTIRLRIVSNRPIPAHI
ncbi:MAG TPA: hypothetical protein VK506_04365 [Conexibacter sp.]|nr:hypothetical protein [Conexibacter sp.]